MKQLKLLSLLLCLCLLVTALPGVVASAEGDDVSALLVQARRLYNQGHGLDALELLHAARESTDDARLDTAIRKLMCSQNRRTEQIAYRSNGDIVLHYSYMYGDDGRKINYSSYTDEGMTTLAYEYDDDGLLTGYTVYQPSDPDAALEYWAEVELDACGDPIRVVTYDDEGVRGSFEYENNEYGEAVVIRRFDRDGELTSASTYTFDDYGIWTSIGTSYPGRDNVYARFDLRYEFDDEGHLTHVQAIQNGRFVGAEYSFTYIPFT